MTDDIVARLRLEKRELTWRAADEIERLRAEVERLTRERDEAREYAVKRSKEAHAIELELHARAEAAERKVEKLREALSQAGRALLQISERDTMTDMVNGLSEGPCALIADDARAQIRAALKEAGDVD